MSCQQGAGPESAYTIDASRVTFGEGSLREVGDRLRQYAGRRVALITDPRGAEWEWHSQALESLTSAGYEVELFDEVEVEPTDASMRAAVEWARGVRPDLVVSLGGGSVIDTAKVANLLSTHDGELLDYVNAPLGAARPVPGPLKPHLALPTTSGTGSEVTGIAIFDLLDVGAKSGISSMLLRPTEAIVDPAVTATLPAAVVASSGLDVLCHALESLTARPFTARAAPSPATSRPPSQGANPWSDLGCREALTLIGRHLRDAVDGDPTARRQMMWAATLAGIAFGNAGVHVPHAMAYAVAGRIHDLEAGSYGSTAGPVAPTAGGTARPAPGSADTPAAGPPYRPDGYPGEGALVPHGFAVAVSAPAVFRHLAPTSPERHLLATQLLDPAVASGLTAGQSALSGGHEPASPAGGSRADEIGQALAGTVASLMRDIGAPNGLGALGYTAADIPGLVDGASPQRRLLDNAPTPIHDDELTRLFEQAASIW